MSRLAVVPPVPALLPEHAGLTDPVAELRRACRAGAAWLVEDRPERVTVLGDPGPLPRRVARWLLGSVGFEGAVVEADRPEGEACLVLANGSARRGEKAPGHLDERSLGFDQALGEALSRGDAPALAQLDVELAEALLAAGAPALRSLGCVGAGVRADVLYDDDPYGVQYWVVTWSVTGG